MDAAQKPSVGRIVHFLEVLPSGVEEPQAAIITKVGKGLMVELTVFPPREEPAQAWEVVYVATAEEGFELLQANPYEHYWTWPLKV